MSHNLIIPLHQGVSGRFKVRRMKGDAVIEESGWSSNLLVNGFFDDMLSTAGYSFIGMGVGTGTAAPAETDTTLQTFLAGFNKGIASSLVRQSATAPRYVTRRYTIRSTEGQVVGNISEIGAYGITPANTGSVVPTNASRLWSRARILDGVGNPTTITVLADEFLEAVWELTIFAATGSGILSINLLGTPTNFNYEIRPVSMQHVNSWPAPTNITTVGNSYVDFDLGFLPNFNNNNLSSAPCRITTQTVFASPDLASQAPGFNGGDNLFETRTTLSAYTTGSKTRTSTIRVPLTQGNFTGIRSFYITHGGQGGASSSGLTQHQILLDATFTKLNTQIFELTLVTTLANTTPP